jgi:glycosyltransferase involved in cell wall biosynthesis
MSLLYSVVTVCKNSESTISKTIESVLVQTYSKLELIIIDGMSTDDTPSIVHSYKDERIKYVREIDFGIYYAMNRGIGMARGDVVSILNSDDFYLPQAIDSVNYQFHIDKDLAILCSDVYCINLDKSLNIMAADIKNLKTAMVPHPGVFMKRNLKDVQLNFREDLRIAADYGLLLRNYVNGVKMKRLATPIAFYSKGGFSDSPPNRIVSLVETFKIQRTYITNQTFKQMTNFIWNTLGTLILRDGKLEMFSSLLNYIREWKKR